MTFVIINGCVQLKVDIDEEIETSENAAMQGYFALLREVNLDYFPRKEDGFNG